MVKVRVTVQYAFHCGRTGLARFAKKFSSEASYQKSNEYGIAWSVNVISSLLSSNTMICSIFIVCDTGLYLFGTLAPPGFHKSNTKYCMQSVIHSWFLLAQVIRNSLKKIFNTSVTNRYSGQPVVFVYIQ